jgi:hypothetical protein
MFLINYGVCDASEPVAVKSGATASVTVELEYRIPDVIYYQNYKIVPGQGCWNVNTGEKLGTSCEKVQHIYDTKGGDIDPDLNTRI